MGYRRAAIALPGVAVVAFLLLARGEDTAPQDIAPAPRAVPDRPLRLTAFGTSLTRNGVWPEAVAETLAACLGRPVAVARVAEAGVNSGWGVEQAAAVAATAPDLVLIEFAINDADLRDGVGIRQSQANLRAILALLSGTRTEALPVIASTSPATGLRGWARPFLGRYEAAARNVAAESGAGFFDGAARWRAVLAPGDLPDGLHPAAEAERRVLVPALTAYLGAVFGKDCGRG